MAVLLVKTTPEHLLISPFRVKLSPLSLKTLALTLFFQAAVRRQTNLDGKLIAYAKSTPASFRHAPRPDGNCGAVLRSLSTLSTAPLDIYAITNARIVTVSGPKIEHGTVVIRNGLIAAVGDKVSAPSDARVIDGSGLTVYPGLIDANTNLGLPEAARGAFSDWRTRRLSRGPTARGSSAATDWAKLDSASGSAARSHG